MDNIINLLKDEERLEKFIESYCKEHGIDPETIDDLDKEDTTITNIILSYVPDLVKLNHEEKLKLLQLFPELYGIIDINLTKEETLNFLKDHEGEWQYILKKHPEYFDRELVAKYAHGSNISNFGPYIKEYNEIFEGVLIGATKRTDDFTRQALLRLPLNNEQLKRIFTTIDFGWSNVKEEFLENEEIVQALLKSNFDLPSNVDIIPTEIIERNMDLFLKAIAEHRFYNIDRIIFKSETIFEKYLNSNVAKSNNYLSGRIDSKFLPVLEKNIDRVLEVIHESDYNSIIKNSEVFLKKTWKKNGLDMFDSTLVAGNLEYLIKNGLDIKNLSSNSKHIVESSIIVRKILEYEIKNGKKPNSIELAFKDGLTDNIEFALDNGYVPNDNSPEIFFENETIVKYLINNKKTNLYYLISPNLIDKYADSIIKTIPFEQEIKYGNLLSNPQFILTIIDKTSSFDILHKINFREDWIDERWIPLVDEIYKRGYRLSKENKLWIFIWCSPLLFEYLKVSKDPYAILLSQALNEEIVNYAADLGFILKNYTNGIISTNDKIIKNTLMNGDIKTFDFIGRPLTDSEVELAYQRGYRLTEKSSFNMRMTSGMFKKEISLNNSKCLNFIETVPDDELVRAFFNQGNMITSDSSTYLRCNPLTIHIALQKTNDPLIIDLATDDINEEDFDKAISLGYKITEKTPYQILNNEHLMNKYLKKEMEKHPEAVQKIEMLSKKIGANAVCLALDNLLLQQGFLEAFSDIEIEKIIKFVYFVDTKNQLIEIAKSNNSKLLKKTYLIISKLNPSSEFDVITFKKIVTNFSNYIALCNNFVKNDYTTKDIKLLYKVLVDGVKALTFNKTENKEDLSDETKTVSTLEELRNYKTTTYQNYQSRINSQEYSSNTERIQELKDIVFQLLCNKTYNQIDNLLNQFLNIERIDELLDCIKNQDIKNELENYRVFIELIETIFNMYSIENLINLANSLNDSTLKENNDIDKIWTSFNNIEAEAKRLFGEEIREAVTHFNELENREDTQIITDSTDERRENAQVIVHKGKYSSEEFEYDGDNYYGKVDLIELNGTPFITFVHVLNAYGFGAKLADFKNPRLIGKTYICTSAMSDENAGWAKRPATDINNVAVLFSNFNSDQLALASERDIGSNGANNDMELTSWYKSNLRPVRKIINQTYKGNGGYNEYVFYREDNQGNTIYPSAILVQESEPSEGEIQAAIYLGVPLVKINKEKYTKRNKQEIKEKRKDLKASHNMRPIEKWKELRRSIEKIKKIMKSNKDIEENKKNSIKH